MSGDAPREFHVPEGGEPRPLSAVLRSAAPGASWRTIKGWIADGRVVVDGRVETRGGAAVAGGARIEVRLSLPRPRAPTVRIVHADPDVVVVDKPAGMESVPFERGDRGSALDHASRALGRRGEPGPLFVVHRLDRETSGLLLFARTRTAARLLQQAFAVHDVERVYRFTANGVVAPGRRESRIADDRGDGRRGSVRGAGGRPAITDVTVLFPLAGATAGEARLHTGRTHQIRIHLAETGNPVVGERVYSAELRAAGGRPIAADRLQLHAAVLGFAHPRTGERLRFESPPPADFRTVEERLSRVPTPGSSGRAGRRGR